MYTLCRVCGVCVCVCSAHPFITFYNIYFDSFTYITGKDSQCVWFVTCTLLYIGLTQTNRWTLSILTLNQQLWIRTALPGKVAAFRAQRWLWSLYCASLVKCRSCMTVACHATKTCLMSKLCSRPIVFRIPWTSPPCVANFTGSLERGSKRTHRKGGRFCTCLFFVVFYVCYMMLYFRPNDSCKLPQRETPNSFFGKASGGIWEASGGIWEASERHLGGIWEASTVGFSP